MSTSESPGNERESDKEVPSIRRVGIALSGGGHRAAAFGLGALLYLVDARWHERVRAISSVSGGSILNAYLSLSGKPLGQHTAGEFEELAHRVACEICGFRLGFKVSLWLGGIASALAAVALASRAPAGWIVAALALAAVAVVIGSRRGGTVCGWSGSWLYLFALVITLVYMPVRLFAVIHTGTAGASTLLDVGSAAVAFWLLLTNRGIVVDWALRASIRTVTQRSGTRTVEDFEAQIDHVVCATEMHGGQHFYFTRRFVYSPAIGVGEPGSTPVGTAVQASACYPGAFPFRRLGSWRFRFSVWDMKKVRDGPTPLLGTGPVPNAIDKVPRWLMLADGGIHDNLAVAWYLGGNERARRIDRWLIELGNFVGMHPGEDARTVPVRASIRLGMAARDAMWALPDALLVVNGGLPQPWHARIGTWIPGLRTMAELVATTNTMYSNTQSGRVRDLQLRFSEAKPLGAIVDISEVGVDSNADDCKGVVERRLNAYLEGVPFSDRFRSIGELELLRERNLKVPTTLLPLGPEITADLMRQGYLQAMVSLHVRVNAPLLPEPQPGRFLRIVDPAHAQAASGAGFSGA